MKKNGYLACGVLACATIIVVGCNQPSKPVDLVQRHKDWLNSNQAKILESEAEPEPDILPITYFAAGQLFEKQGNVQRAILQYRKAIDLNPSFVAAYNRLGLCLDRVGQYRDADEAFTAALAHKPKSAQLHNNLAFSLMLQRRWAEAEGELRSALRFNPNYERARINLGLALSRQSRFDEAFEQFKFVVGEVLAHYNMGLMYKSARRYAEASDSFRTALVLEPRLSRAKLQWDQMERRLASGRQQYDRKAKIVSKQHPRQTQVAAKPVQVMSSSPPPAAQAMPPIGPQDTDDFDVIEEQVVVHLDSAGQSQPLTSDSIQPQQVADVFSLVDSLGECRPIETQTQSNQPADPLQLAMSESTFDQICEDQNVEMAAAWRAETTTVSSDSAGVEGVELARDTLVAQAEPLASSEPVGAEPLDDGIAMINDLQQDRVDEQLPEELLSSLATAMSADAPLLTFQNEPCETVAIQDLASRGRQQMKPCVEDEYVDQFVYGHDGFENTFFKQVSKAQPVIDTLDQELIEPDIERAIGLLVPSWCRNGMWDEFRRYDTSDFAFGERQGSAGFSPRGLPSGGTVTLLERPRKLKHAAQ